LQENIRQAAHIEEYKIVELLWNSTIANTIGGIVGADHNDQSTNVKAANAQYGTLNRGVDGKRQRDILKRVYKPENFEELPPPSLLPTTPLSIFDPISKSQRISDRITNPLLKSTIKDGN
jgi:hypothetical protein